LASSSDSDAITVLLSAASSGDRGAAEKVWDLVYAELRHLARRRLSRATPGQTLQPTGLVHEAFLRLAGGKQAKWESRAHFFGAAARAMRNVLVDHARRKDSEKHGGDRSRVPLTVAAFTPEPDAPALDLLALDEALEKLERDDPRMAQVVMLRYFAGLTIEDTARALEISTSTVEREWSYARAWLYREMSKGERGGGSAR